MDIEALQPASPAARTRQRQRRFTATEATEVIRRYRAGFTMNQLAAEHQVHRRTIAHCLQSHQVPVRQLGLAADQLDQAAALYRADWSLARIGDKFGTTDMTVRRALAKHGVAIRRRNGWS